MCPDKALFNTGHLRIGLTIEPPSDREVQDTPQLFRAPLEKALLYGGDLTRAALSAMRLTGAYRHILVDTRVHMLMPGFYPAIPGWHTDGVPRGPNNSPSGGDPLIQRQNGQRSPHYHLLVTGEGALTDFATNPVWLTVPSEPTPKLYEQITEQMDEILSRPTGRSTVGLRTIPSCTVAEWDWWQLHRATAATKREWRYLIRVTETDYLEPNTNLSDILRTQTQVYVPPSFGW